MNRSYVAKADEQSRYASLGTPGVHEPDPTAPPITADSRRQRLLQALEEPDTGQSLAEVEQLVADTLGDAA